MAKSLHPGMADGFSVSWESSGSGIRGVVLPIHYWHCIVYCAMIYSCTLDRMISWAKLRWHCNALVVLQTTDHYMFFTPFFRTVMVMMFWGCPDIWWLLAFLLAAAWQRKPDPSISISLSVQEPLQHQHISDQFPKIDCDHRCSICLRKWILRYNDSLSHDHHHHPLTGKAIDMLRKRIGNITNPATSSENNHYFNLMYANIPNVIWAMSKIMLDQSHALPITIKKCKYQKKQILPGRKHFWLMSPFTITLPDKCPDYPMVDYNTAPATPTDGDGYTLTGKPKIESEGWCSQVPQPNPTVGDPNKGWWWSFFLLMLESKSLFYIW